MCDPVTLASSALSLAKTASGISSQNKASAVNRKNSITAMNDEQASSTAKYIEDNRSLIQGGFDGVLQGREDEALAYASAIENGVQGASVKALLRDRKGKAARSKSRTQSEVKSLRTQQGANLKHIVSKTNSRINAVPTTSFNIGDAAVALAPIVKNL